SGWLSPAVVATLSATSAAGAAGGLSSVKTSGGVTSASGALSAEKVSPGNGPRRKSTGSDGSDGSVIISSAGCCCRYNSETPNAASNAAMATICSNGKRPPAL